MALFMDNKPVGKSFQILSEPTSPRHGHSPTNSFSGSPETSRRGSGGKTKISSLKEPTKPLKNKDNKKKSAFKAFFANGLHSNSSVTDERIQEHLRRLQGEENEFYNSVIRELAKQDTYTSKPLVPKEWSQVEVIGVSINC